LADVLTSGVKRISFWRPAQIELTDASQSKFLVGAEDGAGGYVAISRQTTRGEVIVLTQSLWWNWIRSDPANEDNCLLLENLLGH
jgi:hypothetical protein